MRLLSAIYRLDPANCGDLASAPHLYFNFRRPIREIDISGGLGCATDDIIVGGGGVLLWTAKIARIAKFRGTKIFWGGGCNSHGGRKGEWDRSLKRFQLVGVRDWGSGWRWVPCSSCMSTLFDRVQQPQVDYVFYGHQHFPINSFGWPYLENDASIDESVEHIAKGAHLVTSSYHGAYWGTLLGRRVTVIEPFSTKFFYMRHPPAFAGSNEWRCYRPPIYPSALEECRSANRGFYKDVSELLHT